ncbi:M14 family metallopeptidase [Arenibaculum pallidiluteum]|uniref:succinylglutamate desuccinylase/aspartoacylase domain-containing protein n=1 Tax=Arenibaculum pallidiluteum TaxID=2812559 RepID=UPI001F1B5E5E|nr:succinylglutamate desuccinylase/aspartoacylase family protein [Arenibaculum pallidiluteum]
MNATDPPVELAPPDITPFRRGNTGTEFATTYDSGVRGPHALINALMHGNELGGAIALDFLHRSIRPRRGHITLVHANVAAFARFDPRHPARSRFVEEDMNRVWDDAILDGPRRGVELDRARALRPLYAQADALLDLHSMQLPGPPLLLCGRAGRARRLARELGWPGWVVADGGHVAGPRLIDYRPFAAPEEHRTAVLLECGQHWARASALAAIEGSLRFLVQQGVIDAEDAAPHLPAGLSGADVPRRFVEITEVVTAGAEPFTWTRGFESLELVAAPGTVIGHDGGRPIATPYPDCVLLMPARQPHPGQTAVRLGRLAGTP